jgi:lipopolysaccharide/colanic/teichoic acid biosynthesis glycosyltransferase
MAQRALDILVSGVCILFLAVPFVVIALLIKLDSRGPAFFLQERIGKDGKPFKIWKFRTMVDGAINIGLGVTTTANDDRITRVGRVLRALSLDELPQIVNVFKGDMALVGPRPTLRYQVEQYTKEQRHRLDVKPGITSWAVVNGRNNLTWEERIKLDLWYVRHKSLLLDLKVLLKTPWVVLVTREGVYNEAGPNDDFSSARNRPAEKKV